MAIKTLTSMNPNLKAKSVADIYEEASASVAADTLLTALGPQLERALEAKLHELFSAPPELGALLDARANLKALWNMRQGLKGEIRKGKASVDIMNQLLLKSENY